MKKVVLGLALSFGITSMVSAAEQTAPTDSADINCAEFSSILTDAQSTNLLETVTLLATSCQTITDQIVEKAVSLTPTTDDEALDAAEHQKIMQAAADTIDDAGSFTPADILIAALTGGGNPALLSEPTAGGSTLAITPPSPATTPAVIGGRNGGAGVASVNN
jgi:hypothetical protein